MNCINCEKLIEEGSTYCSYCGTKINLNKQDEKNTTISDEKLSIQPSLKETKKPLLKNSKQKIGIFVFIFIIGLSIINYTNTSNFLIFGS